ncbi:hypothetical protein [Clostridium paraputrificum]|uniref:hypothetical protein n=1 Tax=Clostridium paraputrificum TaxID=29363 RepID=UPI00189C7339|nr:hypothetical protein [Clostridium paraputrificum]
MKGIEELMLDNQIKVGCIKQSQEKLHIVILTDCQRSRAIELIKDTIRTTQSLVEEYPKDMDLRIRLELDKLLLEQFEVKL